MKSKLLCITLLVIFCIAPLIVTADSANNEYIFENDETTITINGNDLTEEKANSISNEFLGIADIKIAPYNILCIFGHDIVTGELAEIAHSVYSNDPKCHYSLYAIEYCSRTNCNYTGYNLISSAKVACH